MSNPKCIAVPIQTNTIQHLFLYQEKNNLDSEKSGDDSVV